MHTRVLEYVGGHVEGKSKWREGRIAKPWAVHDNQELQIAFKAK